MDNLIESARNYAIAAHRRIGHLRKYNQQPYEVHLKAVADLVATVTDEPETIAAAWLHDIVEDTEVTFEDLEKAFGPRVARLVHELTDISRPGDGNRARRKAIDRDHLAGASASAQTVKLADLCDNASDICRADPKFGRVFLDEMNDLLAVLGRGHPKLMAKARKIHAQCLARLAKQSALPVPDVTKESQGYRAEELMSVWRQLHAFCAHDLAQPLPDARALLQLPADQIVESTDSLINVVAILTRHDQVYVRTTGEVTGVLTRADLERPIGRMWLFGMLTLIELDFSRRIHSRWPDEQWRALLTPGRLAKAVELQQERLRRNQSATLLDCLQLSDKGAILITLPEQRAEWRFSTMRMAKSAIKDLESLRNHLVHAQNVVDDHWHSIARLVKRFEEALMDHTEIVKTIQR